MSKEKKRMREISPMGIFFAVFCAVFYALLLRDKITGNLNWSWWILLAPAWLILAGSVLLLLFGSLILAYRRLTNKDDEGGK